MSSILITGATGFFGQGYVRQLLREGVYKRICIYSRDEYKQHLMRVSLGSDPRLRFFIGDVRDLERLSHAMKGVDHVVHAAALKRVEVGEYNPDEMVKTNVMGSLNVITAAQGAKVKKLVALSTDKACSPLNAYGASKLLVEKMMLAANKTGGGDGTKIAVTRYGNVAGSTGSVIPTWRKIIGNRKDAVVPVSDPQATRFWMTLQEAVDLVAGTMEAMTGGELVVPQLPAYRVFDLASAMGAMAMNVSGLQNGEKMHEQMISEEEARLFSGGETTTYRWNYGLIKTDPRHSSLSSETAPRFTFQQLIEQLSKLEDV